MLKRQGRIIDNFEGVINTSNPLRAGEPGVVFSLESNAWGKGDSPQKVWQHLAMSMDRCQVLTEVFIDLKGANDFAKRTITSYLVLELHAIFKMVRRARSKALAVPEPRPPTLATVEGGIEALIAKGAPFATLRDKLTAHLDGDLDVIETHNLWMYLTGARVQEWIDLLNAYVVELGKLFPSEFISNIKMRNLIVPGLPRSRNTGGGDYTRFDSGVASSADIPPPAPEPSGDSTPQ